MSCGGEKGLIPRIWALGDRIVLDASVQQSTAFEPIILGGRNAVRVNILVTKLTQFALLDVVVLGSNTGENWSALGGTTLNGQVGAITFQVTQIAFAFVKIGARAYNGSGRYLFALDAAV